MMIYGDGPATTEALEVEEVTLPSDADASRAVRSALEGTLTRWGWSHRLDDACLCASELLTVALDAGYDHLEVVLCRLDDRVAVEVRCGGGDCRFSEVLSTGENGRSLAVVDGLAGMWGVRPTGDGDAIWFELR
jgi:hypothetical protein